MPTMGSKQSKPQDSQRGTGQGRFLERGTMASNAECADPKRRHPLSERSMRSGQVSSKKAPKGRPTRQHLISRDVGTAALTRAEARERTDRTYRRREPEVYSSVSSSNSEYSGYKHPSISRNGERNDSRLGEGAKMITVEVPEDEWLEFQEFMRSRNAPRIF